MRYKIITIFLLILATLVFNVSLSAETITITAVGEYVLGDNDTYIEGKKLALQDAKRIALEKVGTYLESTTEVKNGAVSVDEIRMYTAGIIKIEEITEERSILENKATIIKVNVKASIDPNVLLKQLVSLRSRTEIENSAKKLNSDNMKLRSEINQLNQQLRSVVDENRYRTLRTQREEILTKILENEKGLTVLVSGESLFNAVMSDRQRRENDKTAIRRFIKELAETYEIFADKPDIKDNDDGTAKVIVKGQISLPSAYPALSLEKAKYHVKSLDDVLSTGLYFSGLYSQQEVYAVEYRCRNEFEDRCSQAKSYLNSELKKLKIIGKMGKFNNKKDMFFYPHINQKCVFQFDFEKIPIAEIKAISKIDLKVVYEEDDEIKPDNKTDGKALKKKRKGK